MEAWSGLIELIRIRIRVYRRVGRHRTREGGRCLLRIEDIDAVWERYEGNFMRSVAKEDQLRSSTGQLVDSHVQPRFMESMDDSNSSPPGRWLFAIPYTRASTSRGFSEVSVFVSTPPPMLGPDESSSIPTSRGSPSTVVVGDPPYDNLPSCDL